MTENIKLISGVIITIVAVWGFLILAGIAQGL